MQTSLNQLEESIKQLANEKLEWPEFDPPQIIEFTLNLLSNEWSLTLRRNQVCKGDGRCFDEWGYGVYHRAIGYGCHCQLKKCASCFTLHPAWFASYCPPCEKSAQENDS